MKEIEVRSENAIKDIEIRVFRQEESLKLQEAQNNDVLYRIQALESKFPEFQEKLTNFEEKFNNFEEKIHLIESLKGNSNEKGPDLSGIINQIALFRSQMKDFASKEDLDALKDFFSNFTTETNKNIKKIEPLDFSMVNLKEKELPAINVEISGLHAKNVDFLQKFVEFEEKFNLKLSEKPEKTEEIREKTPKKEEKADFLSQEAIEKIVKEHVDVLMNRKVNYEDFYKVLRDLDSLKEALTTISEGNQRNLQDASNKEEKIVVKEEKPVSNSNSLKDAALLKEIAGKVADLESLIRKVQRELNDVSKENTTNFKEIKEGMKGLEEKKLDRSEIKGLFFKIPLFIKK